MIRKTILLLTTFVSSIVVLAQQPSNVTGTTDPIKVKRVGLFKVLNGRLKEIATAIPDAAGRFGFQTLPQAQARLRRISDHAWGWHARFTRARHHPARA